MQIDHETFLLEWMVRLWVSRQPCFHNYLICRKIGIKVFHAVLLQQSKINYTHKWTILVEKISHVNIALSSSSSFFYENRTENNE